MRNELEALESAGRMQRVHHPMAPWMRWNALQVLQGSVRRQEVRIGSTDAPAQPWRQVWVPEVRKGRHIEPSTTRLCAIETGEPMRGGGMSPAVGAWLDDEPK